MDILSTAEAGLGTPDLPIYAGYIGVVIAVLFFGSNFTPVKKFETGDGLFFQLFMCVGIWMPSIILHAVRGFPTFWPLAMLGGFIWCTGNILVVPIIQCIGMAMGLLIWGSTNMLMGWASGRFGWFGLKPEPPHDGNMNYVGVVLCLAGAAAISFIKPHIEEPNINESSCKTTPKPLDDEQDPLLVQSLVNETQTDHGTFDSITSAGSNYDITSARPQNLEHVESKQGDENSLTRKLSSNQRKIVGIVLSLIAGALFGSSFAPVIYIKDNYPQYYHNHTEYPCVKVSSKDLDYVFPHFTGILLTSVLYFMIYCAVMKNKPRVYPRAILPAFACGLMWGIADIGFFLANEVLNESISFPIIVAGPGIIASLWGLFVFQEIRGLRNILVLGLAFCLIIAGCVLCGISK